MVLAFPNVEVVAGLLKADVVDEFPSADFPSKALAVVVLELAGFALKMAV